MATGKLTPEEIATYTSNNTAEKIMSDDHKPIGGSHLTRVNRARNCTHCENSDNIFNCHGYNNLDGAKNMSYTNTLARLVDTKHSGAVVQEMMESAVAVVGVTRDGTEDSKETMAMVLDKLISLLGEVEVEGITHSRDEVNELLAGKFPDAHTFMENYLETLGENND